jgi:hypothetical protein
VDSKRAIYILVLCTTSKNHSNLPSTRSQIAPSNLVHVFTSWRLWAKGSHNTLGMSHETQSRSTSSSLPRLWLLWPCTFRSFPVPFRPFRLRPTLQLLRPIQLSCCVQLVQLTYNLWGFRNEGLLSVPQIKHMTYATMLPSYCSYCLSLYLLSFTYFFPH